MAQYDYKCPECDMIHSVEHSVDETPAVECKLCKKPMRKIFSAPIVTFKGKGWGHQ
jgi:putative FmdB family regulatory protein